MKLRIAFSLSKTERKLRFRFWKLDIWSLDLNADADDNINNFEKDPSKAGFLSLKNDDNEIPEKEDWRTVYGKLLVQALFCPTVEKKIFGSCKKIVAWMLKIFSIGFEKVELRGSLGDPFYDSIAQGALSGTYLPDWENSDKGWSLKGEAILKFSLFRFLVFVFGVLYKSFVLLFVLWRGVVLARKNPEGENLHGLRRWLFLRTKEAMQA